jgi:hypothetical protein
MLFFQWYATCLVETCVVTSVNLEDQLTQSLGGTHMGRIVYV